MVQNKKSNFFKQRNIKLDVLSIVVLCCVLFLVIFGCIMVYSATYYSASLNGGNKYWYLVKQIVGVVIGFCGMTFFYFFPYQKLKKFKWWAVLIACVLLIMVFIPYIGVQNYGAKRWIGLFGLTFQPSELASLCLCCLPALICLTIMTKSKVLKPCCPFCLLEDFFACLLFCSPTCPLPCALA